MVRMQDLGASSHVLRSLQIRSLKSKVQTAVRSLCKHKTQALPSMHDCHAVYHIGSLLLGAGIISLICGRRHGTRHARQGRPSCRLKCPAKCSAVGAPSPSSGLYSGVRSNDMAIEVQGLSHSFGDRQVKTVLCSNLTVFFGPKCVVGT